MLQMIFTLLLFCATGALGVIVQRPKNLAMSVDGSSYFNCSTDVSEGINWVFTRDGDLGSSSANTMTNRSCDIVASFSGNFRTEKPNSTVCNLIVFNANLQLGGYYACVTGIAIGADAIGHGILVVADTRSNIESNVTEFIDGCKEDVSFEMTVDYNGPSPIAPSTLPALYPSLKWALKSDPNNIVKALEDVTNTTSSSKIIVNATIPSVPSYVCTLYFKPPTNPPPANCDTSTPSFTFNWTTSAINTSCNTLNQSSITVTSYIDESGICEAKILECHPYAYPPPHDVHWLDVIRNEVVYGTRIPAEFGGEYVCSVTNIIKGNNYTASVTYNLDDESVFTMDKCEGVSEVNVTVSMNNGLKIFYAAETLNTNILRSNSYAYHSQKAAEAKTGNATEAIMACSADGLPNPSYAWYSPDCPSPISTYQNITVNASSSYTCAANNSINDRKFSKSITIQITLSGTQAVICSPVPVPQNNGLEWLLLLILLLLVFLLPACVFLPYYGCSKSCRENVNDEFPWIEKALPCMNGKGCECSGGMVLFIFCLVIWGLVFVPWILIASHCCQKNKKKSQGDINLQERNGSTEGHRQSAVSRSSSTGAPNQAPPPRPPSVDHSHNYQGQTNYHPSSNRSMHSPSPVSSSGVEYGELKIDAKPGSRRPVELIIQKESAYAELQKS